MRLIDADAIRLPKGFFEKVDNVPKFYEWLNTLPTIEAEPVKHGRWIKTELKGRFVCSECGQYALMHGAAHRHFVTSNFCPNCGADMREVKE